VDYPRKVILCIAALALFGSWGCAGLKSQMGAAPCDCFPEELLTEIRPWRGGLVGEPPGDTIRVSQKLISERGSREAATRNKPVDVKDPATR
jgi:hypothetical protein